MRRSSLRTILLVISVLFAMLVVGGIALTTYVIVSDGMQVVAIDTTRRLSSTAEAVVRDVVSSAERAAAARGLSGDVADRAALQIVASELPGAMARAGMSEAAFVLYDSDLNQLWASRPTKPTAADIADRKAAQASGTATELGRTQRRHVHRPADGGSSRYHGEPHAGQAAG